ncbi:hypothetical protein AAFF_G00229010 [Aldrovandia affinis]|uniref:E-selectin n=1 Tax=Aldrovandia affinis TaxID=143900 RepID=A0AAD7WUI3_9TELE|nr:hypothetical protein AAFF_G00229010 [Aldrovandia affinis]
MDLHSGHQSTTKNLSLSICYLMLATLIGVNGWTYHYSNHTMNWKEAKKWCQAHHMDMVAIQNREENVYLDDFLPRRTKHYWIGLHKKVVNGKFGEWTWVGTNKLLTPDASNWATDEPNNKKSNEVCVEMYVKRGNDTGKWNDESCRRNKTALCYTASCQPDSCSGHGECAEVITSLKCECSHGFSGEQCERAAVRCSSVQAHQDGSVTCTDTARELYHTSALVFQVTGVVTALTGLGLCQFGCEDGYQLVGSVTIQCTASREWSAAPPRCEAVDCEKVYRPSQGSVSCSHPFGDFSYGSECQFGCEDGYQLVGSVTIQCTASREWSAAPPRCEAAVRCSSVQARQDGSVTCTDTTRELYHTSALVFQITGVVTALTGLCLVN